MITKVTPNTIKGVYQWCCRKRLSSALAVAMIIAVKNDSSLGERFLVSSTDMVIQK